MGLNLKTYLLHFLFIPKQDFYFSLKCFAVIIIIIYNFMNSSLIDLINLIDLIDFMLIIIMKFIIIINFIIIFKIVVITT